MPEAFPDGGDKDTADTNPCPHGPCIAGTGSQTTTVKYIGCELMVGARGQLSMEGKGRAGE